MERTKEFKANSGVGDEGRVGGHIVGCARGRIGGGAALCFIRVEN